MARGLLFGLLAATAVTARDPPTPGAPPARAVVEWRLPMLCELSGFLLEALDFVVELDATAPELGLRLTGLHGDCASVGARLAPDHARALAVLRARDGAGDERRECLLARGADGTFGYECVAEDATLVPPDAAAGAAAAAAAPLPARRVAVEHGQLCKLRARADPAVSRAVTVARVMTEAARLSRAERDCLARVAPDELWVPSAWHADVFAAAGVAPAKARRRVVVASGMKLRPRLPRRRASCPRRGNRRVGDEKLSLLPLSLPRRCASCPRRST